MNAKILTVFLLISYFKFISSVSSPHYKRYENYALYKAVPMNVDHIRFLQNLEKQKYVDVIFWQRAHKLFEDTHFIVNPKDQEHFLERTQHYSLSVEKILDNVQKAFDTQTEVKNLTLRLNPEAYSWDKYHSLLDINQWLKDMALAYPNFVKVESIGKSTEGRDIFAASFQRNYKEKVLVEGGIHGNEWLGVEFVTFLINELLEAAKGKESDFKDVANKYSWYLVPVLNPDGYEYNQNIDRMWRKNRKTLKDGKFVGVDLDRNFDYSFGKFDSSFNPDDENFCGTEAFSEPESQAWASFVNRNSQNLKFYFSFRSYGQKIVIPYGDTVIHEDNFSEMENFAKQAIIKIFRRSGVKYSTGTTYDTLGFKISGDSASWVKKTHHVKYVFTMLLRDSGKYGYALPTEQILPACKETLIGLTEIMTAKPRKLKTDMFSSRCKRLFSNTSVSFVVVLVMLLNYLC